MKMCYAIRARRIELGLTLSEVAAACDVTKSAVCKWERGSVSSLKADVLTKLASVLKCNPLELCNDEVERIGIMPLDYQKEEKKPAPQITEKQAEAIRIMKELSPEELEKAKQFVDFIISQRGNAAND